jgi:hypothetical protein
VGAALCIIEAGQPGGPAAREALRGAAHGFMFVDSVVRTDSPQYNQFEGARLGEIAARTGKETVDLICDIVGCGPAQDRLPDPAISYRLRGPEGVGR